MLAALELNDQSLLMQAEDGAMHAEPGFAYLTPDGIVTGEAAHAMAWREPQHSYNQFWCHLNETPLAAREKWARHHGDIAFAQLRGLWQGVGEPEALMVLASGNMTDEQLSLLLGMIEALPATPRLVVDSALAACLPVSRDTLFIDMQLHQTVLSLCQVVGDTIRITDQEVFPALGMLQLQNSMARHISNLMIADFRYDPLHASASEQAIYDRLPAWLTHLCWESEVSDHLDSEQGQLPFILQKGDVKGLVQERLEPVMSFVDRHRGCDMLLSHASGLLAGLADVFAKAKVLPQSAATDHSLSHHPLLLGQVDGLYRLRELSRGAQAKPVVARQEPVATHILHDDRALPLHRPVSIHLEEEGVRLASKLADGAALTVVLRNSALETVNSGAGLEVSVPEECRPGEFIVVDGHRLRLIEVQGG